MRACIAATRRARRPREGALADPADWERRVAEAWDGLDAYVESALRTGLTGERRRAAIQFASSLRNLGRAEESVALLMPELEAPAGRLDDAVRAVLALALADVGRAREGVGHVLTALAPHLPRYQRSMGAYARHLTARDR